MLHLVYRFRPTVKARSDLTAFWHWIAERQNWFYDGLDMVRDTRWHIVTIGPDVHCLEHWVSFANEAAWGSYRQELRRRSRDLEWERRRTSQDEWYEIIDSRILTDPPISVSAPAHPSSTRRSRQLLDNARFVTLATTGPEGPWASTVNYVALYEPLRLLWYSMRTAQHSRNIAEAPQISGSVYLTDLTGNDAPAGLPIDGAQLSGNCREAVGDEIADLHHQFYERNFPDPELRQEWLLPLTDFRDDGPRRFYVLEVERLWIFDAERWKVDKYDTRIEIPVDNVRL